MASSSETPNPDGSPTDTILEVRDTSVTFEMSRGRSRVLDGVSLDIRRGEILGVVGESGSGKSMFAAALLDAIVEPGRLTGEISYFSNDGTERDILSLSDSELESFRWEEIAMVFQGALSSFNPTMSLRTHFRETLSAHDQDPKEGMNRARQLLADLYLDPDRILDSYPHELSGGMKQRTLIALSLLLEPEVLVLDEPTAALDLLMQRSIISLLDEIQSTYDITLVFITHDLPLVAEMADRLAVMYAFEFIEIGPATQIITGSNHPYTRALINSTPNLDTPVQAMRPIPGESPDPVDVPAGCSYHPRCPMSDDLCVAENPSLFAVDESHVAACHYWEEVPDQIELSLREYAPVDGLEYRPEEVAESESGPNRQADEPLVSLSDVKIHFESTSGMFDRLFGEPEIVHAVDGVDLDIWENDVVVLVGESGCGKTTLGKAAIGIQRPTDGTVEYRGREIWAAKDGSGDIEVPYPEIRKALQIIHQDPGSSLNPNKTIRSTLSRPLKIWNDDLSVEDREARIYGMLERVGMAPAEDYAKRFPHQLSGGEKQRVALIRALLLNPDLILADEAVSALDVSLRVDMMDLMIELQQEFNTSYLFISHNLSNARYIAERTGGRIGIMYLGEIVEIGPADDVLSDPEHPYTEVLKWSTANLNPTDTRVEEPPIREIDIPDPKNPPTGCHFHTRCPHARELCTEMTPGLEYVEGEHRSACFRSHGEDHSYWESDSIVDSDVVTTTMD